MTTTIEQTSEKDQILDALGVWIRQRPGLDFGNYGDWKNYRAEVRSIQRDLDEARQLLRSVQLSSVSAEVLKGAFRAFSGRLTWNGTRLEYCAGQYWPTEYRKAACAVLAAALWDHYRDDYAASATEGESAGNAIRRQFKRSFGKRIANRWFN